MWDEVIVVLGHVEAAEEATESLSHNDDNKKTTLPRKKSPGEL